MTDPGCTSGRTKRLEAMLTGGHAVGQPVTVRDYLEQTYELAFSERGRDAVESAERGLALAGADPVLRLRLLGVLISLHINDGDLLQAEAVHGRRLELLGHEGRMVQREVEEHLGLVLFREATEAELPELMVELERRTAEDAPPPVLADLSFSAGTVNAEAGTHLEAVLLLRSAAAYYREDSNADGEAGALMYLANSLVVLGDEDAAATVVTGTLALPVPRAVHASVLMLRSRMGLGSPSKGQDAVEDALRALEIYHGARIRPGAIAAGAMVGQELLELGESSDAALALRLAVQHAELSEHETLPVLKLNLGNALLQSRDFPAALATLADAHRLLTTTGASKEELASVLSGLGHAQRQSGLAADALASWQQAAVLFESTAQYAEQARTLMAMGTLLAREGRQVLSLAAFDAAVAAARHEELNPLALPEALHTLGYARCEAGDPQGLRFLDEALTLLEAVTSEWLRADFTDSKARALSALNRGSEAVAWALKAADLYAAAGDDYSAGNAELLAGQVLMDGNRAAEAEAILRNALEHLESDAGLRIALLTAAAEALDQLGRSADAERVRAEASQLARDATS